MSDDRFPSEGGADGEGEPEVRLELTNAGVRQIWALHSQERPGGGVPGGARYDEPDPGFSLLLRDLPELLWRGKWYVTLSLLLSLGLGTSYLSFADPIFSVETLVLIERESLPLEEGLRLRPGTNFLSTQAEIIHSPTVIERAMTSIALAQPARDELPAEPTAMDVEATNLAGTNVVSIAVRTTDPALGVRLSGSIIESYQEYLRATAVASHSQTLDVMARSERELRAEVEGLRGQYDQLREESGLIGHGTDAHVQNAILERQAQMLVEARIQRVGLENRLRALKSEQNGGRVYGETGDRIRDELWRAHVKRAELAERYSDKHPDLRSLDPQIDALESLLERSAGEAPAQLERDLRAARQTESRLEVMYQDEIQRGRSLSSSRLREDELLAKIQRVSAAHDHALKELQARELKVRAISEGQTGTKVQILEGPGVGEDPIWPQPILVLAPCALVGLIGAIALCLIVDRARAAQVTATVHELHNGRATVEQAPAPAAPLARSAELAAGFEVRPEA